MISIAVDAGHLTAQTIDQLRQVFHASVLTKPPYSSNPCCYLRTSRGSATGFMHRAAELQYCKALTSRVEPLFPEADGAATFSFDPKCRDGHRRQREGDKRTRGY
jgi:hypothetical protein